MISVVIPVRNKAQLLDRCVGSIVAAAEKRADIEVLLVENHSQDDTARLAREMFGRRIAILEAGAATAAAARNEGAEKARGKLLCFLDADVVVPQDFFDRLAALHERFPSAAIGCSVSLPATGSWIDRTWGALHESGFSGDVSLLNGACLAVPRQEFTAVGGFKSELVTGEDADLCLRLIESGVRVLEFQELRTIHLDNPQTVGEFFRKEAWRGIGALATVRRNRIDRPATLTLLHGFMVAAAVTIAVLARFQLPSLLVALSLSQAVPLLAVGYRSARAPHPPALLPSLLLYQVYFLARLWSYRQILAAQFRTAPA